MIAIREPGIDRGDRSAQKNAVAASKVLEEFTRLAATTAANREKIDDAEKRIDQLRAAGK